MCNEGDQGLKITSDKIPASVGKFFLGWFPSSGAAGLTSGVYSNVRV